MFLIVVIFRYYRIVSVLLLFLFVTKRFLMSYFIALVEFCAHVKIYLYCKMLIEWNKNKNKTLNIAIFFQDSNAKFFLVLEKISSMSSIFLMETKFLQNKIVDQQIKHAKNLTNLVIIQKLINKVVQLPMKIPSTNLTIQMSIFFVYLCVCWQYCILCMQFFRMQHYVSVDCVYVCVSAVVAVITLTQQEISLAEDNVNCVDMSDNADIM